MKYILQNDERSKLKKKSKNDKEELFYSLWKERDPTPNTERNELMEEYYERVSYVNEHFDGWQPGWETDRGMIYILFGPPDEIQRTNSSTTNSSFWNDGNNINGPSLIKVPDWVENPLGEYYLYFAHHSGKYIRMAYSMNKKKNSLLDVDFKVHEPGTLK